MRLIIVILFFAFPFTNFSFGQLRTKEQIDKIPKEQRVSEIMKLEKEVDSLSQELNSLKQESDKLKKELSACSLERKLLNENSGLAKIGDQLWMKTNLDVTTMNDGTPIFYAQSKKEWDSCFVNHIPAYCYHEKDTNHLNGVLYNVYALRSPKLAPLGYKIPTSEGVELLINSFGPFQSSAGLFLKSKDKNTWSKAGTDLFGMNVKPDGFRLDDANTWYFGDKIYLYCEGKDSSILTFYVLSDVSDKVYFLNRSISADNFNYGMYVRCLKSK